MPRIFINFRNGDGEWAAKMVQMVLEQRFGEGSVFLSHESIKIGQRWPDALLENAATCDVFLALIGPQWLSIPGRDGRPRIFAAGDWVRREIATALAADRIVAPVLLGDTPRLRPDDELPPDIRGIVDRQGPRLDVRKFDDDLAGLERELMEIIPELKPMPKNHVAEGIDVTVGTAVDAEIAIWDVPEGTDPEKLQGKLNVGQMTRGSAKGVRQRERQGKGDRG